MLGWYDPETGQHIPTFNDKQEAQLRAEARAEQEREGRLIERNARLQAEARSEQAEARADTAEAQVRELQERLRQRENG